MEKKNVLSAAHASVLRRDLVAKGPHCCRGIIPGRIDVKEAFLHVDLAGLRFAIAREYCYPRLLCRESFCRKSARLWQGEGESLLVIG